jgi:hypothetical protein
MSFTLKQVRYFVGVAEFGSVSRAAQELAISQSAITEAIKDLEQRLGVKLFDRRRRGLETTYHGHVFLRHAKAILAEVSNAETIFDGTPVAKGTRLNVGVTSLTAGYVLSDILARFRRACPEIEVNAVEDTGEYLEHPRARGAGGPRLASGGGDDDIVAWPGYIERGETDQQRGIPRTPSTGSPDLRGGRPAAGQVKTANTSDEMVALMNEGGFDLVTASGDASLRLSPASACSRSTST